mmetsp:Transcript_18106/g.54657  ORF Transcript_18106/g.54657 Transcript_18106/m.54657 type:complete len:218 (-) Transcript_18106:105-758(-)
MSCSPEPPMTVWSLKISSMECSSVATLDGECEDAFFPTDVLLTVFMSTDSWPLDSGVCDCDGDVRVSGVTGEAVVGVPAVEAMMASTTSSVLQMWTRHEPVLNPLAQASALADSLLNLQKTTMRTGCLSWKNRSISVQQDLARHQSVIKIRGAASVLESHDPSPSTVSWQISCAFTRRSLELSILQYAAFPAFRQRSWHHTNHQGFDPRSSLVTSLQ